MSCSAGRFSNTHRKQKQIDLPTHLFTSSEFQMMNRFNSSFHSPQNTHIVSRTFCLDFVSTSKANISLAQTLRLQC